MLPWGTCDSKVPPKEPPFQIRRRVREGPQAIVTVSGGTVVRWLRQNRWRFSGPRHFAAARRSGPPRAAPALNRSRGP